MVLLQTIRRLGIGIGAGLLAAGAAQLVSHALKINNGDFEPMVGLGAALLAFFMPRFGSTTSGKQG